MNAGQSHESIREQCDRGSRIIRSRDSSVDSTIKQEAETHDYERVEKKGTGEPHVVALVGPGEGNEEVSETATSEKVSEQATHQEVAEPETNEKVAEEEMLDRVEPNLEAPADEGAEEEAVDEEQLLLSPTTSDRLSQ